MLGPPYPQIWTKPEFQHFLDHHLRRKALPSKSNLLFQRLSFDWNYAAAKPTYSPLLPLVWSLANVFAWDFAWSAAIFAAQSYGLNWDAKALPAELSWNMTPRHASFVFFCWGDLRHDSHSRGESQPWNLLRTRLSVYHSSWANVQRDFSLQGFLGL